MEATKDLPRGVIVIIAFHALSFLAWLFGQTGAVFAYDTVAAWGFQDPRALLDPAIVEVNRGIGLADTIVQHPLFVIAVIGLWRRRFYGAVASWLVFGTTIYWPTVYWCSQYFYGQTGITYRPTTIVTVVIPGVIAAFALWGSWYLARNRHQFA